MPYFSVFAPAKAKKTDRSISAFRFSSQAGGPSLVSANKAVAARKAREIHEHLKVTGWAATLARFKSLPEPKDNGAIQTVGELIAAIEGTTASRGRTLENIFALSDG
jgi:hypothetical protein